MNPIESFQQQTPIAEIEGEVAGLAMPFNVSDERPGLWFDDSPEGALTFFEYTTYAPQTFDVQLGLPEWGGRVRFMWWHGVQSGMTSIPIGNVTQLRATPEALMFRAQLGETDVANELRKSVGAGSVKETSTRLRIVDFTFETDEDGKTYRRVTSAELFDVSLVVHGQFSQARLLEVHSHDPSGECPPDCHEVSQDEHPPPDTVTIPRASLGALYAYIDQIQTAERLRFAKEVATKC